jgi:phenylacetate-CoA ligase
MEKQIKRLIVAWITFPLLSWLYNRKRVVSDYLFMNRVERKSSDALESTRRKRLSKVLRYARRHVPFYRERIKRSMVQNPLESLHEIQPLSRSDVIEDRIALVDRRLHDSIAFADKSTSGPGQPILLAPFKKHKLVRNTSSGSTGSPTTFYEDGSVTARNWAIEWRVKRWFGVKPGDLEARFVRMSSEDIKSNRTLGIRQKLWNQVMLPGVALTDREYHWMYEVLLEKRPRAFWGFTSAIAGLAGFIRDTGLDGRAVAPAVIITWAAPLYPHEKRLMEEVFGCSVTNIYGTRELGHIAAVCPRGRLHVNSESFIVEADSTDGSAGELLVTPLVQTPMPFIRYRTGDIGKVSETACDCGMGLQVIDEFVGRTGEIYTTGNGQMISPNFWCRTFMDVDRAASIRRFQVLYRKDGSIRLLLVPGKRYNSNTEKRLLEYLDSELRGNVPVVIDHVESIKPMISGKYQMVVKE